MHGFEVLALAVATAGVIGALFTALRQPLIIAFLLSGVLFAYLMPAGVADVEFRASLDLLAELGIVVLLFAVGLKLTPDGLKSTGVTSVFVTMGRTLAIPAIGFAIVHWIVGYDITTSFWIAMALGFASTIIVIKSLADRRELESLHGTIAVGSLILDDIIVIFAMLVIMSLNAGDGGNVFVSVLQTLGVGAVFFGVVILFGYKVLPKVLTKLVRSEEMLVLFTIAWAVGIAVLGDLVGLSFELGAFVAGFSLATSPKVDRITIRLTPIQDFLILFFFLKLGIEFDIPGAVAQLPLAIVLSIFVTFGSVLFAVMIMGRMGYRRMTGFFTGLALSQVSEFSLILMSLGVAFGYIGQETLALVTMVAILTITMTTYGMRYGSQVYAIVKKPFRVFQPPVPHREDSDDRGLVPCEYIVIGYGAYGHVIADGLADEEVQVLVVDFDPRVARKVGPLPNIHFTYGDAEDPDLLNHLELGGASWIVSTIESVETSITLVKNLAAAGYTGRTAVRVIDEEYEEELRAEGVDLMLHPVADAGDMAVNMLLGLEVHQTGMPLCNRQAGGSGFLVPPACPIVMASAAVGDGETVDGAPGVHDGSSSE